MTILRQDSFGNRIEGAPTIGPRGQISKRDSLTTATLVMRLAKVLAERTQSAMACTDDIDSIGNKQENVVPLGPRGPSAAKDSRRA